MTLRYRFSIAFVAFALFVAITSQSHQLHGQPPSDPAKFKKEPPRPGDANQRVREMMQGKMPVSTGPNIKQNKADLLVVARSIVYTVTDPVYYYSKDLEKKDGLAPQIAGTHIQDRMDDLDRLILKPTSIQSKLLVDQVDYIREFGVAVDTAIKDLNLNAPATPDFIRVNGGRMLAIAARSGAPAFGPTLTAMINDPNTRPELLLYALHAAEGLLAAYNPTNFTDVARTHNHTIDRNELYALVMALENVVMRTKPFTRPAPPKAPPTIPQPEKKADPKAKVDPKAKADPKAVKAEPKAPAAPAAPAPAAPPAPLAGGGVIDSSVEVQMTSDQLAVFHFIRRAAIRALAQVRFPVVSVVDDTKKTFPMYTLARVAVADPAIVVAPKPDEVAEATLGLCNCSNYSGVNVDVIATAVAHGITNFARKKSDKPDDHTLPWKGYSLRLNGALTDFQKTVTNRTQTVRYSPLVTSLNQSTVANVLTPIDRAGNVAQQGPAVSEITNWIQQNGTKGPLSVYADSKLAAEMILRPAPTRVLE